MNRALRARSGAVHFACAVPYAGALVCLLAPIGCAKKIAPEREVPAPVASALAADRLLPGELAEGRERAMGLALPRDMRVARAFADTVFARGRVSSDALTQYVSQRIDSARAEMAVGRTVFARVHVKGAPPERRVSIEVVDDEGSSELVVRDVTAPPMIPGLSEEERWKKAGVVKGRGSDPSAL